MRILICLAEELHNDRQHQGRCRAMAIAWEDLRSQAAQAYTETMNDVQNSATTAALILAAGSSSRMGGGRHKLLLQLGDRPVLAHVIEAALASQARPIVVVLGHQADQVQLAIAAYDNHPTIHLVENPDYRQGMSTSLHVGIQALMQLTSNRIAVDSTLILLGDQPLMTAAIIDQLIAQRQRTGRSIITPLYRGKRGQPVLFAASLFPELLEVDGDEGARKVIEQHRQDVASVELGDAFPTFDVDTWEAYQEVLAAWEQMQ